MCLRSSAASHKKSAVDPTASDRFQRRKNLVIAQFLGRYVELHPLLLQLQTYRAIKQNLSQLTVVKIVAANAISS